MWPHPRMHQGAMIGTLVVGLLSGGCGSALLSSDGTGSLLDLLAGLGVSEETTLSQLLDQVTVGDVLDAVGQFTESATTGTTEAMPAKGPHGGPRGPHMGPGGPPLLDLTDEQRQAAEEIRQAEREDIEALWVAADEDIRALLTEEQLAIYDELPPLMPGGGHGPPPVQAAGPRDPLPDFLAEKLGLSEEQQTAVEEVLTTLRAATEARRADAREAFLALLTDEQREQLEQRPGNATAH